MPTSFLLLLAATVAANDFDREIAPIFVRHCLDCHSGPKPKGALDMTSSKGVRQGGDSGAAISPGKPSESLLWERVSQGEMPPKEPLSPADQAAIRVWIESGASWGTDPIDSFQFTTNHRAGRDWWALQPLKAVKPAEPAAVAAQVDRRISEKLAEKGLTLSPEADRRTLIRRATFDLHGLLPSPEEADAFVNDPDPNAYSSLIDRLLASPRYGERWGRHWLDVARYGESDGFERNLPRLHSWPYRDWVIKAFNDDLRYDEFCRLQIAGDVLRPNDPEAAKATGFLVAAVHNTTLGNDLMRAIAKQDELEELVGTVGQTFFGLTVNCARCHDHKYDPIGQVDYYRMASALSGVEHGNRQLELPDVAEARKQATEALREVDRRLKEIESPIDLAVLKSRLKTPISEPPPIPVGAWDLREGSASLDQGLAASGGAKSTPEGGVLNGVEGLYRSLPLETPVAEKTLEAWIRLDNLKQRGGGAISIVRKDGTAFDAIVFGEIEEGRWMAGSENFSRTKSFEGEVETDADRSAVHLAITYQADGTVTAYRNGKPYGRPYQTSKPVAYPAGEAFILLGCRHEPPGGNRMLAGTIVKAKLYDRALTVAEVARSAEAGGETVSDADREAALDPPNLALWKRLKTEHATLAKQENDLKKASHLEAYVANSGPAAVTRLLVRGQLSEPAEVVVPGGVRSTGPAAEFQLPADAPEHDRRRALSNWITSTDNPLFARVLVNRVWHHHFGTGLVETPNDFGFNGGRPSHPELLDELSGGFVTNGYSIKNLHRSVMLSKAYRQGSERNPRGLAIDADNRLLWRKSPRRLDAESVRDSMLQTAGLLNLEMGGQGFSDYVETFNNGTTYFEPTDPVGAEFQRRSVYRFVPRGANQGLLDTFDCPDPSANAPRRSLTTTPIQALALWNNAFSLRMTDALAERLNKEIPDAPNRLDQQISRLWSLAYQRPIRPDELPDARAIAAKHGLRALGRAVFNSNEFLNLD